jgi:hypothetical protein
MPRTLDTDDFIRWEDGDMTLDQEILFFQTLVDQGLAFKLQGMYGRRAEQLIKEGYVQYERPASKIEI